MFDIKLQGSLGNFAQAVQSWQIAHGPNSASFALPNGALSSHWLLVGCWSILILHSPLLITVMQCCAALNADKHPCTCYDVAIKNQSSPCHGMKAR